MCDIGSCEAPTIYTETNPTARKRHICCECGSTIEPGERYERVDGLWSGQWESFKTCEFCAKVRFDARYDFDLMYDEAFPFGQLWECVGVDYASKE
jgi:hypothetical protein